MVRRKGEERERCPDHQCLEGALKDSSGFVVGKNGLEDCGGSKVVVAESTDAVLWGSGGPCKGGSGVGREAARLSLHWKQSHRARC